MEFCPFRLSPSASRVVPMPNGHLEPPIANRRTPRSPIVEPPLPIQNPPARRGMAYKVLWQWLRYISIVRVQRLQAVLCRLRLLDVRIRDVAPVRQLVAHYLAAPAPRLHPCILSLHLWGDAPDVTRGNKLPKPAGATVTWIPKRRERLTLQHLDSGMSRDVYMSTEAPYVLKLQAERWHEYSNAPEALLGVSSFAKLTPRIYGSICTLYRGVPVSVLVAERVPHTYRSWCEELVQTPLDFTSIKLLLDIVAAFFELVVQGAGILGYQLRDLHWENLGITVEQAPTAQTCAPRSPWKHPGKRTCFSFVLPGRFRARG